MTVVLDEGLSDGLLLGAVGDGRDDGLGDGLTDGVELGDVTTTEGGDVDVDVLDGLWAGDDDWLHDLCAQDLWSDQSDWDAVETDLAVALFSGGLGDCGLLLADNLGLFLSVLNHQTKRCGDGN